MYSFLYQDFELWLLVVLEDFDLAVRPSISQNHGWVSVPVCPTASLWQRGLH